MDSINRIEGDRVEFTGGVLLASYVAGFLLLILEYIRPV